MRRWYLALAVLLTGSVSVSHANYVIIRVVLKQTIAQSQNPNAPTTPGANAIGQAPTIYGNQGGPPTGYAGNRGGPPPGYMGTQGGPPPGYGGYMGGPPPGYGGYMGAMGGVPPKGQIVHKHRLNLKPGDYVTAVIPINDFKVINRAVVRLPNDVLAYSKWGRCMLFKDGVEVLYQPYNRPSPNQQFHRRSARLKGKRTPDELHRLALWCLTAGLNDKCMEVMEEIDRLAENGKADVPERVAKALEAYKKIKPELNRGTARQDQAKEWSERLSYPLINTSEHYALLYGDEGAKESVQRRLKFLEYEFRAFYLWHALKGKALDFPEQKLVTVLVNGPDFQKYRQIFDADESVDDGFHARRDNVVFFVGQRLDEGSRNFDQLVKSVYREFSFDKLLEGSFFGTKINYSGDKTGDLKRVHLIARAQTLALADAALQEEGELASATHEGARQLFYATGMLPKNVAVPQWARFGLAAVFESPKGPFPSEWGTVKSAFWPGVGGPSWAYMSYFSELEHAKRLPLHALEVLLQTINDDYFHLAQEGLEAKRKLGDRHPAAAGLHEAQRRALDRARTLSWGLAYFLASERFDELQKYYEELARMPRDLELDEHSAVMVFARAFGLTRPTADGDAPDMIKFAGLAEEWLRWMKTQRSPIDEFKLDEVEVVADDDPNAGFGPPGGGNLPFPPGGGNLPFPPGGAPRPGGGGSGPPPAQD